MSTVTSLITFAEFEQLPDLEAGKRELIEGEIVTVPPPELDHTSLGKRVFLLFLRLLGDARIWPDHTGYRIGGGWVEPDVSVS